MNTPDRRYKVLLIEPRFVLDLLRGEFADVEVAGNPLPKDAQIRGVGSNNWRYSAEYGCIALVIESAEFDHVPEGNILPVLEPVLFRRKDREHEHA